MSETLINRFCYNILNTLTANDKISHKIVPFLNVSTQRHKRDMLSYTWITLDRGYIAKILTYYFVNRYFPLFKKKNNLIFTT